MFRAIVRTVSIIVLLTLSVFPSPVTHAQASFNPLLLAESTLPRSNQVKAPHIVATGTTVHASGNTDRSNAAYWSKADSASNFGDPSILGDAKGFPDNNTTALAVGPDGAVYMAWINQDRSDDKSTVLLRRKPAGGDWEPTRQVIGNDRFRVSVAVGVATTGRVFVIWREVDQPIKYRTSTNGGVSWASGTFDVSSVWGSGAPEIATGPNGQVIIAYSSTEGRVYAATWDGNGFFNQAVSRQPGEDDFHADPTVTIAPNGRAYVAWRSVTSGVYYAERQPDGSWPPSRLAGGRVEGTVSINADALNNVHIFWSSNAGGPFDIYYAFKTATGDWQGPLRIPSQNAYTINVRSTPSIGAKVYVHAVYERFSGSSSLATGYYLLDANVPNFIGAKPVLENGAAVTRNTTPVLTFTDLRGTPTQVRWRWGAAPSDSANDSGGWRAFGASIPVPAPANLNPALCNRLTLFTQVRNAQNTVQATADQTSIALDTAVQAAVRLVNPGIGDAAYTRLRQARLEIGNTGECAGLASATIGASVVPIPNNQLVTTIDLPSALEGPQTVALAIADKLGNTQNAGPAITYDATPPSITAPGTLAATNTPDESILLNLRASGVVISDTLYPAPHVWGLQIAASRTPTTTFAWSLLQLPTRNPAPTPPGSLDVSFRWNLARSLPLSALTPGEYYVYLRFLDGAGNPTTQVIETRITLDQITFPKTYVPLARK